MCFSYTCPFLLKKKKKVYSLWMKSCLRSGKIRKKAKFFLLPICGPIPRVALKIESFTSFRSRNEAPDCAWSVEGRGRLKLREVGRGGRQDLVGGDRNF